MQISSLGISAAVEALSQVQANVAQTAGRIAEVTTGGGDVLDLSAEMIALLQARHQSAALTNVIQAANQLATSSLNLLA
jgi:hypothetical protein